jgi:HlyD family secretion protein
MLRIADLNKMEVRVDVNENDIIRVSLGDTVEIEVDSYSSEEKKFKGLITEIANSPNDESMTSETITEFEVRIKIINTSYNHLIKKDRPYPFKPGMTASVDIITDRKSNVLSVPLSSVTTRTEKEISEVKEERKGFGGSQSKDVENEDVSDEILKEIVFVYNGETKKVESREVKTGISDFDNIEIKEGIKNGDQIIKGPYLAVSKLLKDGSEVEESKGKKTGRRRE